MVWMSDGYTKRPTGAEIGARRLRYLVCARVDPAEKDTPTLVGAPEVTVPLPSADRQRPGSPLSRAVGGQPGAYSAAEPAVTASTTSPALVISTLRGLASSATGMVRVSTPFS